MDVNNQNQRQEIPHKRRVRYSGTHPKKYKEKYKEHNPEKYADTIEKVIQKGSTPAGMHISICVKEIIDFLQIQPGQVGLDATLGYGGYAPGKCRRAVCGGMCKEFQSEEHEDALGNKGIVVLGDTTVTG